MKKNQIITVILVLVLILSLVIAITSCNNKTNADAKPTETAVETVEIEKEISETEKADAASTEIEETEETKYSVSSAIDHEAMLLAQIEKRMEREKVTPTSYQKAQEEKEEEPLTSVAIGIAGGPATVTQETAPPASPTPTESEPAKTSESQPKADKSEPESAPTPSEETPAPSAPSEPAPTPSEPKPTPAPTPAEPEPVHTHNFATEHAPTCTESGYFTCECGATNPGRSALGHLYDAEYGTCVNCGAKDPYWTPPHTHNWVVAGGQYRCCKCGYETRNGDDIDNHSIECESNFLQWVVYRCECGSELVQ